MLSRTLIDSIKGRIRMFEDLFNESDGNPINYKNNVVCLSDKLLVQNNDTFKLTFESTCSEWKQGVSLFVKGSFVIDSKTFKRGINLWEHTAPTLTIFTIVSKKPIDLVVCNIWDIGDGVVHSSHNGAAMIVEDIRNGKRYLCNDGYPDDDFNDLIFRIEKV